MTNHHRIVQRARAAPPIANADILFELPLEVWQQKQRLITEEYGFAAASWEARVTPRREGFFRVKTAERAAAWLEQRRSE